MRGERWLRKVLVLALALSVLVLAGHAGAVRIARAWSKASPTADGGWSERPWCLSPSRPYLCLLEYRFRVGGGLAGWFTELGPMASVSEKDPLD